MEEKKKGREGERENKSRMKFTWRHLSTLPPLPYRHCPGLRHTQPHLCNSTACPRATNQVTEQRKQKGVQWKPSSWRCHQSMPCVQRCFMQT